MIAIHPEYIIDEHALPIVLFIAVNPNILKLFVFGMRTQLLS